VLLVSITQNGLNLMGVSPFAFKMIVGAIILVAITLSSTRLEGLFGLVAPRNRQKSGQDKQGGAR
jgi:simple sugar transport system permease protein